MLTENFINSHRWRVCLPIKKMAVICFLILPLPAFADTGFPMIFQTLPMMVLALIPLAIFEAVIVKLVTGATFHLCLKTMTIANVITTFVGLPLSNIIGMCLALMARVFGVIPQHSAFGSIKLTALKATFGFFYFDPVQMRVGEDGRLELFREPRWYVLLSILFALFVNFMVSWYLEYLYMRRKLDVDFQTSKKAAIISNACSYAAIVAIGAALYVTHKR